MSASAERYSAVAVALHWAIAILILGQIAGGLFMHNLPNSSAIKFDLYQLHKSFGLSVLALTVFRLGWRLTHRPPSLPVAMPGWEKLAARAAHWGFYALLVLTPLAGWAMVSVSPTDIPTKWFGVIPVPHLPFFNGVSDPEAMEDMMAERHEMLAFAILFLLVLHVGAALKHQFVNKDGVLASMLHRRAAPWIGVAGILGALCVGAVIYMAMPGANANGGQLKQHEHSPGPANQAGGDWVVDYDASRLRFVGEEKGKRFEGGFANFNADIIFDPDELDVASLEVTVSSASASTGDDLRDSNLPGREWFDVKNHPQATFSANDFRTTGKGAYEAAGVLQIKDIERPVTLAFTLEIDGAKAVAMGGAELIRTDFGLGEGAQWLDDEGLALSVRVEFEIHATRKE